MKCPNDGSELELNEKKKKHECPYCDYYQLKESFEDILVRLGRKDKDIDSCFIRENESQWMQRMKLEESSD